MGINLGVALGAAAESGMSTYSTLKKLQREEEAAKRDQERFERERKDWEQKDQADALMRQAFAGPNEASGKSMGQALQGLNGTDSGSGTSLTPEGRAELEKSLAALPPEQAQAALRAYGSAYGGNPDAAVYQGKNGLYATDKPYNPEQAYVDAALKAGNATALKEARANQLTGLQIQGAQQGLKKGDYELRSMGRAEERDTKFRETMDSLHKRSAQMLNDVETTAQTEGMKGLVGKYGSDLKKAYGYDVALVGNNIIVKDAKGKPVQTISNINDAKKALEMHFQQDFAKSFERELMPLFGSPKELADYLNNRDQLALKGREVSAKEALVPSEIRKNDATAYEATKKGDFWGAGGSSAGKGSAGPKGLYETAKQMVADGEAKDVESAILALKGKQARGAFDVAWEKTRLKLTERGATAQEYATERALLQREYGFAPEGLVQELRAGKGVDAKGKPRQLTAEDVAAFNERYPASAVDPNSLGWSKAPPKPDAAPAAAPEKPEKTPVPTNNASSNPYRHVTRGGTTVDQAALESDLAEYNKLANSAIPLAAGRRKLLEQKLRAAGAID